MSASEPQRVSDEYAEEWKAMMDDAFDRSVEETFQAFAEFARVVSVLLAKGATATELHEQLDEAIRDA